VILYHGSNLIVERPVILPHNRFLDFGFGFYTTPSKEQAVRFSEIVENRRGGEAVVSVYNFDDVLHIESPRAIVHQIDDFIHAGKRADTTPAVAANAAAAKP
jgi:hypothetical protein